MIFNKEVTAPPFAKKITEIINHPLPHCLRLLATYFSYRDINPLILLIQIYDGMPGLVNLFCRNLKNYLNLVSGEKLLKE